MRVLQGIWRRNVKTVSDDTDVTFCGSGSVPQQWSFRKTGTMGTLASQAESGVLVRAPGTLLHGCEDRPIIPGKNFVIVYMHNPAMYRGPKMVRNAVRNALLNTLTMGKASPLEMTPVPQSGSSDRKDGTPMVKQRVSRMTSDDYDLFSNM